MTDKKNYKEKETLKERGTKRYQQRIAEEREAEEMIKDFEYDEEEYIDISSIDAQTNLS